jgi:hypothetical protein
MDSKWFDLVRFDLARTFITVSQECQFGNAVRIMVSTGLLIECRSFFLGQLSLTLNPIPITMTGNYLGYVNAQQWVGISSRMASLSSLNCYWKGLPPFLVHP